MLFKHPSRPYDPTGRAILNFVESEIQEVGTNNERLFVPSHGPFYLNSLTVMDGAVPLVRNVDYFVYVLHVRASKDSGKPVACCIKVVKKGVSKVSITYQAVGGKYNYVFEIIKDLIEGSNGGVVQPIYWDNILDKPKTFNPASHMHPYWEFEVWQAWLTPLDEILQGILFRKIAKVQAIYDYYHSKLTQFKTEFDNRADKVEEQLNSLMTTATEPVGSLIVTTGKVNITTKKLGVWSRVDNRIIGIGSSSNVGTEFDVSEDIVYPQPDNILLDEKSIPIIRDDDSWMYLDNKYPVEKGDDGGYGEDFDEQFDLHHYMGYEKLAHADEITRKLTSSKASLKGGESVTFTLTTTGYASGTTFRYILSGVTADNVDKPTSGLLTIDASGKASLTVTLLKDGPATGKSSMMFAVSAGQILSTTVTYTLDSNNVYRAKGYISTGYNTVKLDEITVGDGFYLVINTQGLVGKTVEVDLKWAAGAHTFSLPRFTIKNGKYQIPITDSATVVYASVASTQVGTVQPKALGVSIAYNGTVLDAFTLPAELLEYECFFRDAETLDVIDEVSDGEKFLLEVRHNSRQNLIYYITPEPSIANTSLFTPFDKTVYVTGYGRGRTTSASINRAVTATDTTFKVSVQSPMLSTVTQSVVLKVLAEQGTEL